MATITTDVRQKEQASSVEVTNPLSKVELKMERGDDLLRQLRETNAPIKVAQVAPLPPPLPMNGQPTFPQPYRPVMPVAPYPTQPGFPNPYNPTPPVTPTPVQPVYPQPGTSPVAPPPTQPQQSAPASTPSASPANFNGPQTAKGQAIERAANFTALFKKYDDGLGSNGCMAAVSNVLRLVDGNIPKMTHTSQFIDYAQNGPGRNKFDMIQTTIGDGARLIKPGDVVILGDGGNQHATIAGNLPDYWGKNRNPNTVALYGNTGGAYNSGKEFVPSEGRTRQVSGAHWRLQEVTTEAQNHLADGSKVIGHGAIDSGGPADGGPHSRYNRGETMYIFRPK